MTRMRLQKYLAGCGLASRRKCEEIIVNDGVRVNGKMIRETGVSIDDEKDIVEYKGRKIRYPNKKYYMLNKPVGYITSSDDPRGRKTVLDLIEERERLYPVGRLDRDTSGMLLMTNDGDFTNRITHPRYRVKKTYRAVTLNEPEESQLEKMRDGMLIDGKKTTKAHVAYNGEDRGKYITVITISEGRNRQVRKMFESAGLKLASLKRTAINGVKLGRLKKGAYRELTREEIDTLNGKGSS